MNWTSGLVLLCSFLHSLQIASRVYLNPCMFITSLTCSLCSILVKSTSCFASRTSFKFRSKLTCPAKHFPEIKNGMASQQQTLLEVLHSYPISNFAPSAIIRHLEHWVPFQVFEHLDCQVYHDNICHVSQKKPWACADWKRVWTRIFILFLGFVAEGRRFLQLQEPTSRNGSLSNSKLFEFCRENLEWNP